jgi:hypothetical protein
LDELLANQLNICQDDLSAVFKPEAFQLLAGGKRSATTGKAVSNMPNIPEGLQRGGRYEYTCRSNSSGINRVALAVYRW